MAALSDVQLVVIDPDGQNLNQGHERGLVDSYADLRQWLLSFLARR
jgi:hypothetical protein